jgi:hypothetical protein
MKYYHILLYNIIMTEIVKLKKNYVRFGKFQINEHALHTTNKLMVSYLTGSPIMTKELRTQVLSDELASIIINIIDTLPNNEVDIKKVNRLSEKERNIFNKLIMGSGLAKDLKYKAKPRTIQEMVERFEIVQGSINAGNDSQVVINEAIELVKTLSVAGKISATDASELLGELNDN